MDCPVCARCLCVPCWSLPCSSSCSYLHSISEDLLKHTGGSETNGVVHVSYVFLPKVPPSCFSSGKALGKVASTDEQSETGGVKRRVNLERNQSRDGKKNWWPTVWWNDDRLKQIYYMAVFRSIVALSKTCNAKYHISFRASANKINPVPRHLIYVQWNEFKESDQWMRNRILLCVRSNKCRKMLNTKAFVKFLLGFVTLCI